MEPRNKLIGVMPPELASRLLGRAELVTLKEKTVLERANEPIEFVYFPESAVASVMAASARRQMEVGPFGREGASALAVALGSDRSPHETTIQVAGDAYRIGADAFRQLQDESAELRNLMSRYALAFMLQTGHNLLAAAHSVLEVRLARWILMFQDRTDGQELRLTHDFIAAMLGVRRPGVTVALHLLEGKALIRSKRSYLLIRDRAGLEAMCEGAYGVPEAEYERLIGTPFARATPRA